jgi:hypothetical protein
MAVSVSLYRKATYQLHAKAALNIRRERDQTTVEITRKWKDGYKALKEENDRLQLENNETFHEKMCANDDWLKEQLAMGPPK